MSLKKLGAALLVALALMVVAASSASAAATTTAAKWYTGNAPGVELAKDETLEATVANHGALGAKFQLGGTILAANVEITATGVKCEACKITNGEVTSKAGNVAMGKGSLKFSGVSFAAPAGCTTPALETKNLVFHGDWMRGTENYVEFMPETGTTLATIKIEKCAIAGTYNLKGTLWGAIGNETGVQEAIQDITFSAGVEGLAGGTLTLAGEPSELTGTAALTIASGAKFGIH
jgi:hypothetical protein